MRRLQQITLILFVLVLAAFLALTIHARFLTDHTPPQLQYDSDTIQISVNETTDALLYGIRAVDETDGDLTDQIMVQGVTPLISKNTARVTYAVFDSSSNMATCSRRIEYVDYRAPHFALSKPLVYTIGEPIRLLDRLSAYDVMDGNLTSKICIASQNVIPSLPGTYQIALQIRNSLGDISKVTLNVAITDGSPEPHIVLSSYLHYISVGDAFDPASMIKEVIQDDQTRGDPADVQIASSVNPQVPGDYTVQYTYDSNGTTYTTFLTVVVE